MHVIILKRCNKGQLNKRQSHFLYIASKGSVLLYSYIHEYGSFIINLCCNCLPKDLKKIYFNGKRSKAPRNCDVVHNIADQTTYSTHFYVTG